MDPKSKLKMEDTAVSGAEKHNYGYVHDKYRGTTFKGVSVNGK